MCNKTNLRHYLWQPRGGDCKSSVSSMAHNLPYKEIVTGEKRSPTTFLFFTRLFFSRLFSSQDSFHHPLDLGRKLFQPGIQNKTAFRYLIKWKSDEWCVACTSSGNPLDALRNQLQSESRPRWSIARQKRIFHLQLLTTPLTIGKATKFSGIAIAKVKIDNCSTNSYVAMNPSFFATCAACSVIHSGRKTHSRLLC